MEANEAPEKVYVPIARDELHYHMTCPKNEFIESVEYTRTDALVKKICDWLESNYVQHFNCSRLGIDIEELVEDLKNDFKTE